MVSIAAVRTVLVALIVVGSMAAVTSTSTYGKFSDAHGGTANVSAADSFTGSGGGSGGTGPSGNKGYDDANGDGQYSPGETTYNKNELRNFENRSVDLVIPADVGEISNGGGVSITARSITSHADVSSKNSNVTLSAADSDVSLSGASVSSGAGTVTVDAPGDVTLNGASLVANSGTIDVTTEGALSANDATVTANDGVTLRGHDVSVQRASIQSTNGQVVVSARRNEGGTLDATDAVIDGDNGGIALESYGSLRLNGSTLQSQNREATADLGTDIATLYVDGTDVSDADGTLVYDPDGVTVVGSAGNQTSP